MRPQRDCWTGQARDIESGVGISKTAAARISVFILLVVLGFVVMNVPSIVKTCRLPEPLVSPFAPLVDTGGVPADSLPVDSNRVMTNLAQVMDPELSLSIVELGLVHSVQVDSTGNVSLVLALTTPVCPFTRVIGQEALAAVRKIPGARHIQVRLDPTIPWDMSRVSDRAKGKYESLFGVAPDVSR